MQSLSKETRVNAHTSNGKYSKEITGWSSFRRYTALLMCSYESIRLECA
jgi:hypothetical protein